MTSTNNILNSLPLYGVIASLVLFYQQIKSGMGNFIRLFIKKNNIPNFLLKDVFVHMRKNGIVFESDNYRVQNISIFCTKNQRWLEACVKKFKNQIFFYKNFVPIVLSCSGEREYYLYHLKFTFNFEQMLSDVLITLNQRILSAVPAKDDDFRVETFTGKSLKINDANSKTGSSLNSTKELMKENSSLSDESKFQLFDVETNFHERLSHRFIGINALDDYVLHLKNGKKNKYQFTKEGKSILNQVEKWRSLREWYEERNIAWRRGVCLYGVPGNGKSSLVLEVAKKVGIPLFVFDISNMDNIEFEKYIDEISHRYGILLFEDIDSVFKGRENMIKNRYGSLTFDFFINKLSGIKSINNKFIFFTTNHLEHLDSALIRPGRIDEIIEINQLTLEEKRNLAKIFIEDDNLLIEKCLSEGDNDTSAEFENRCTRAVLEKVWKK